LIDRLDGDFVVTYQFAALNAFADLSLQRARG
jgi:hypothetical protein